jgi:hypothetical protein
MRSDERSYSNELREEESCETCPSPVLVTAAAGEASCTESESEDRIIGMSGLSPSVTNLQRPPSERTPEEKLWDFKTRAQQYARDRESCDDVRISYLEFLETEAEDDLALARMIAG